MIDEKKVEEAADDYALEEGGTIDYLKDNKEAKKLPDNVLKVINKFMEEYTEDKKK